MTTLFVSDVHLDASEPAAAAQFLQFLQQRASSAEALYILGDLFETWVGDDDDEALRNEACSALWRLTASGVPCYVMHGNRDFLMHEGFEQRSGCLVIDDPLVIDLYGEPVLITHGDALCIDDAPYQRLRVLVRNTDWQRRFMRLSLNLRRALADQARAGSQRHTERTRAHIMDANAQAVTDVMRACGVTTMIHGHTHRPAVHEFPLDGHAARRIVLGSWHEIGSCLDWSESGFKLETLAREAHPNESAASHPAL